MILIIVFYWSVISRLSLGLLSVGHTIQTTNIQQKNTATHDGWRWGLIEKKNKIILNMILFRYSNEVVGYLILESQFSVVSVE